MGGFQVNHFPKGGGVTCGFGVLVDGTSGLLDVGATLPLPITIMTKRDNMLCVGKQIPIGFLA